jgi:thioredoxin reductase (NADPH)
MYDLVIIGSGPAGLSAALAAARMGLDYVVLERGCVAQTIDRFPLAKRLFSTGNELELMPGSLPRGIKPTREDLLGHYLKTAREGRLRILPGVEARQIIPADDSFAVQSSDREFQSRAVLVAVGGFGMRRKLSVPGENGHKVSYRFQDPSPSALKQILVVGGGNSAAEAALDLADFAAGVTLSVRRARLDLAPTAPFGAPIKPWVLEPLHAAIRDGKINLICSSRMLEITAVSAILAIEDGSGETLVREVPCDHIFALIGADPDTRLLREAGAVIAEDGRPLYDPETYETTVPGLFVAGHVTRERHIKNAIQVGCRVVETVASAMLDRCSVRAELEVARFRAIPESATFLSDL